MFDLNKIVKEREDCLHKLNQYTGALEELTFLFKNKHINAELYAARFDKVKNQFDKISVKFKQLGDQARGL